MAPNQLLAPAQAPKVRKEKPFKGFDVFAEKKSHFWHYTVAAAAVTIGLFVTSAKVGSGKTDKGIDELCSKDGGLYLLQKKSDTLEFATTLHRTTAKDVELGVTGWIDNLETVRNFTPGVVRFAARSGGLVPLDFKAEAP